MKQRLCGKIIKHRERYSDEQVCMAYNRLVRSLRKFYMRCYKRGEGWSNYYVHKACQPYFCVAQDVDEIWNVKE